MCREAGPDHGALLGLLGDELAEVASYLIPGAAAVEVALAVADRMHGRGIATLPLEYLVSLARARGVKVFVAEVLPETPPCCRCLATWAGCAAQVRQRRG